MVRYATVLMLTLTVGLPVLAGEPPELAVKMAEAYGFDHWSDVVELRYTFNVTIGERSLARSWIWRPGEDRVTYRGTGKDGEEVSHTYSPGSMGESSSEMDRKVDPMFINDRYWLLFPFQVMWDRDATVTDDGMQPLPIGEGEGHRLTVQYPPEGGYTPGDAYELYLNDAHEIVQWVFRRGGSDTEKRAVTWSPPESFGPLRLSVEHGDAEGAFRLWISDVEVKTE